jgi:hypothetical protein
MVRLVLIASGWPGQSAARAVVIPPASDKDAAIAAASLISPEAISNPVLTRPHYGTRAVGAVSARGPIHTILRGFWMNLRNVQPLGHRFTPAERRLIIRLATPLKVQRYLNHLPYNTEPNGDTLRSFRHVVRHGTAHCLEAALFAACVLEQHGYPPLLLGLESVDLLDHVIFVYRHRGKWGSVARSRDPGLHGRKPVFRSLRALAESYFDPYIDHTGRVKGYSVIDVAKAMGSYDWRFSKRNVWAVENMLLELPSRKIKRSLKRVSRERKRYRAYLEKHKKKPLYYRGREKWKEIPKEFL